MWLADRVALADGKQQLYGTQLKIEGQCKFEFEPMDDRARVERRRHELGLPSLETYQRQVQENLGKGKC